MKFRKVCLFLIIAILSVILLYLGIYLYAKITPKLSIDGANGYYLYDNNKTLYTGTNSEDWTSMALIFYELLKLCLLI